MKLSKAFDRLLNNLIFPNLRVGGFFFLDLERFIFFLSERKLTRILVLAGGFL